MATSGGWRSPGRVATEPRVLMLDEPNAGMNPTETADLLALIRRLREELGLTIVMVAHDIPLVMGLCDTHPGAQLRRRSSPRVMPGIVRNNPEVIDGLHRGGPEHA